MIDDPPVSADVVMELLDTHSVNESRISCIAAALRESRQLVGRNPASGRLERPNEGGTWSGALVYLIFAEQMGSCFHPITPGKKTPKQGGLRHGLRWFGGFTKSEAHLLAELRNRLAHDFTLRGEDEDEGTVFTLSGRSVEPVIEKLSDGFVHVGLPALAIRIEQLHLAVLLAADESRLGCHHPGGIDGVVRRFAFSVVRP
jgi:hypothetical protein